MTENLQQITLEEELKKYIESLSLPFPYRFNVEYYKLMKDSKLDAVIHPLIVIGVDRSLSSQERSLIPNNYNGISIQMEFTQYLDLDHTIQKEISKLSSNNSIDNLIIEEQFDDDDEDEYEEEEEDNEMN